MRSYSKTLFYLLAFIAGAVVAVLLGAATNLMRFPAAEETTVPKTFSQMVAEAQAEVPSIKAVDAYQMVQTDPNTLIVDVRDPADIAVTGIIPGAINVTLGTLTYKADHEVPEAWRDPSFADFSRPIITTCETGEMAALAGKLLKDMGYTNVYILEGATVAWKEAGYQTIAQ